MNKDTVSNKAIQALNNGAYVTIIFFNYYKGKDYISGKTFKNCNLQTEHTISPK